IVRGRSILPAMTKTSKKNARALLIAEETARRAQPVAQTPALVPFSQGGPHFEPSAVRRCASCHEAAMVVTRHIANGAASLYLDRCRSCGASGRTSNNAGFRIAMFGSFALALASIAGYFGVKHALEMLPTGNVAEIATALGVLLAGLAVSAVLVWLMP